jgi:Beta-propeller repeat
MLPRFGVIARAWRVAPVLLFSGSLAGPSAPTLTRPTDANDVAGPAIVTESTTGRAAYGQLPLSFEVNEGQAGPSVDFVAHGQGYGLSLSAGQAVLSLRQPSTPRSVAAPDGGAGGQSPTVLGIDLQGAEPHPRAVGEEPLPGTANYFIGSDPSQWHTGIPTYAEVRYQDVYPGIDLVYYGHQGQLENDFIVAPGADPQAIRLSMAGAESVEVDATGRLALRSGGSDLWLQPPTLYQEVDGVRQSVHGAYVLDETQQVGFQVGAYDPTRSLVIDPVLAYSTFIGGIREDGGQGIAVDASGVAYVTGNTFSTDFPTTPGTLPPHVDISFDAFVSKLNASGTALVYSTFLGGTDFDAGSAIAVDTAGHAYVTGGTFSSDFPTTPGAFQRSFHGSDGHGGDTFVAELNATGTALIYSTYLGGSRGDTAFGIAVDTAGNAYVTGQTFSADFPTTPGAFQRILRGVGQTLDGGDAFVSKLNAAGTALVYSTYLGGGEGQLARGIALDAVGHAYVTGTTASPDFPTTTGVFQRTLGGAIDAFVTKLSTTGAALMYSTFLGGTENDDGFGITLDTAGNAYVTGETFSGDFPTTTGAFQRTLRGVTADAFVTKFSTTGEALVYSTFVGGSENDNGFGITLDTAGHAYVTGETSSADFPTTPGGLLRTTPVGIPDAFVTKLSTTGTALLYSTFLGGGSNGAIGSAIAVDSAGNAYITGSTSSKDFPITPGAFQQALGGSSDAFVTKIAPGPPACAIQALLPGPPARLQILVHADRGLASLTVTEATNTSVALPAFTPGSAATLLATATKLDQTAESTFTLHATDVTGASTSCDPALVTIGREPGEKTTQVIHHVAQGENHVRITNGRPGVDRVRLKVNGHQFKATDLHDGEQRLVDVSSAMRKGADNTIIVVGHGPQGSSAVVMIADS